MVQLALMQLWLRTYNPTAWFNLKLQVVDCSMAILSIFSPKAYRQTRRVLQQADAVRSRNKYGAAAILYAKYLDDHPNDGPVHVQAGHMYKEDRQLARAEEHYRRALDLMPYDADLAVQLGHFYKLVGKFDESEREYRRALEIDPECEDVKRELASLLGWGWRSAGDGQVQPRAFAVSDSGPGAGDRQVNRALSFDNVLAPELVPLSPDKMLHVHEEALHIRRLGREERSHWGNVRTLRGVEAVRGFLVSVQPIEEISISLNSNIIHRGPAKGPYILKYEIEKHLKKKYVFNIWLNFALFENGRYLLTLQSRDATGGVRRHEEMVVIAEPLSIDMLPECDGIVDAASLERGPVDPQINAFPTIIRPAQRTMLRRDPETILVLRTDQLGDMVVSVPAMRRLRELFPRARIVGLLTNGNADFARTLGLFDEILTVEFVDDPVNRRRVMELSDQEKLRARLAPYKFDLAIDLADAGVSRPLLLLSGAPVLFGFRDHDFRYLTAGYSGNSHDPWNSMEIVGHSAQTLSLVERLAALVTSHSQVVRREDLSPARLARFDLSIDRPYVLLHAGARIEFSRWPHFHELASLLLERTAFDVVMMGLEADAKAATSPDLLGSDRFRIVDGMLPFDDFDALISFATAFVGNDSGPKHLASLRGVNVVGIHLARNNWSEWGQEHSGVVMSRNLPCAGCNIFYDAEECGKDFVCLRNIKPAEVFDAIMSLI